MRIAIVDDIAPERESLRRRVEAQLDRLALHGDISDYADGGGFLAAAQNERFDLVFLDIYMEQENGVETAERLRRFDTDCMLVFTTASADHALDGFRVRALHYLVKPYTDEALAALFDEIARRLPKPDKYIEIKTTSGGPIRLRFEEILYAEHYRHLIHIYTIDGKETVCRQTFREFIASLSDDRFFQCGRGAVVNMEHAADFDGAEFVLKNGRRLAVSRELSKTARLAFGDFLFKRRPMP